MKYAIGRRDDRIALILMLTRLTIAVINSVNCAECNEWIFFDATYSTVYLSALVYITPRSRTRCVQEISEWSRLDRLCSFGAARFHVAGAAQLSLSFSLSRSWALFIALVSVDKLTGEAKPSLLWLYQSQPRPTAPSAYFAARFAVGRMHIAPGMLRPRRHDDSCRAKIVFFVATHT